MSLHRAVLNHSGMPGKRKKQRVSKRQEERKKGGDDDVSPMRFFCIDSHSLVMNADCGRSREISMMTDALRKNY